MRSQKLTGFIIAGMLLGIIVGYFINTMVPDPQTVKAIADHINLITDIFLRLIKMIIAPLVFSTLVVGIAHMGDTGAIGRIGLKAMGWFIGASLVSLLIGLIMVNLLQPGNGLGLPLPDPGTATNLKTGALSLKEFVVHLVPRSIFEAMATNEILQIVVFSVLFGVAAGAVDKSEIVVRWVGELSHIMLRITDYVMRFAPLAVFAAMASIVATQGLGIILTYGKFMLQFYLSIAILWVVLCAIGFLFLGYTLFAMLRLIKDPILLAFSTASSEAAYPRTMEELEKLPVSERIIGFVLPLGYSFNLDGSMMYCTFATLFIAQAYGIDLSLGEQMTMLLILMVTSKGMAGVPRASLVVIAAALATFNVPEAGLLLIMGIDQLLDMARSATNVLGNSLATTVVAKWEGELGPRAAAVGRLDEGPAALRGTH
ncbi:MAG TPA: dicarboxylate/amino acid:cation symporter [Azospirillum sp.]|nr:dicarboxylate/amino acid:cation symporter [Azospirillum sp.]